MLWNPYNLYEMKRLTSAGEMKFNEERNVKFAENTLIGLLYTETQLYSKLLFIMRLQ